MKNDLMNVNKNELPWIKFSLELLSIDVYNQNIFNKLFNADFLQKHLMREYNVLDYLQLLMLHQGVNTLIPDYKGILIDDYYVSKATELTFTKQDCPLKSVLEHIYGGEENVYSKVKTKYGHFIDHVIVFNENGEVATSEGLKIGANFENIQCGLNEKK